MIKTCKKNDFLYTHRQNMQETTEMTHLETSTNSVHEKDTHATTEHSGPHILAPKGDIIAGMDIGGIHITNTVFSTWIFMAFFFVFVAFLYTAIRTSWFPRLQSFGLDIVARIFDYITSLLGTAKMARRYMWLLGGLVIIIFTGNIFGLILDWFVLISANSWLAAYFRPMYSDLSTTLVFSLTVIIVAQLTAIIMKWPVHHFGHYLWSYTGNSMFEKIVNVLVGWLHFLGEFIRIGSLSLRLFLNIFVGAILISVVIFVGNQIPSFGSGVFQFLSLPFWFFELLVAALQAYIFMTLSSLYIRESIPDSHSH